MWKFASKCLAGTMWPKKDRKMSKQETENCSEDDVSSVASRREGLECPVCWEYLNLVENIPYVLWCGHTLCKNCILGLQWAVVKFPTLPFQLPLFISCPWCNVLSLRLVYRGKLKFPHKNFFLLWMLESMNGDRINSHSSTSGASLVILPNRNNNIPRLSDHYHHSIEPSGSNIESFPPSNYVMIERLRLSRIQKFLVYFVHFTAKFPLVIILLLIVSYVIPASAIILAAYVLITFLFALPSFFFLYLAYPSLDWLAREIVA